MPQWLQWQLSLRERLNGYPHLRLKRLDVGPSEVQLPESVSQRLIIFVLTVVKSHD